MKRINRIMQLLVFATALQSAQPMLATADEDTSGMMSWFSGFSPASIPGYQTWQNMSTTEKSLTGFFAVLAVLALTGGSYWAKGQLAKESITSADGVDPLVLIRDADSPRIIEVPINDQSNTILNVIKIYRQKNPSAYTLIFKGKSELFKQAKLTLKIENDRSASYTITRLDEDGNKKIPKDLIFLELENPGSQASEVADAIYKWIYSIDLLKM